MFLLFIICLFIFYLYYVVFLFFLIINLHIFADLHNWKNYIWINLQVALNLLMLINLYFKFNNEKYCKIFFKYDYVEVRES